ALAASHAVRPGSAGARARRSALFFALFFFFESPRLFLCRVAPSPTRTWQPSARWRSLDIHVRPLQIAPREGSRCDAKVGQVAPDHARGASRRIQAAPLRP